MSFIFISPPFGNYFPEFFFNKTILCDKEYKIKSIVGSFTINKRSGLLLQIMKTLRYSNEYNGWVNKIGLRNPGIEWAIDKYYKKSDIITSVAIINRADIKQLNDLIPKDMNIEVNVSCPNVKKGDDLYSEIRCFLNSERDWCIVKLPPTINLSDIDKLYADGWRQYHCCNTLPVKEGGLSGKSIKPYTDKLTNYISETYPNTIIISGGGIHDYNDLCSYKEKGANHFSVSTLLFNPIKFIYLLTNL